MTTSLFILGIVTTATLLGDYCLKMAASRPEGFWSAWLMCGSIVYGLTGIGWYFLMKSYSLATIGVMFSASTIMLLAGLGHFVFKEQFGLREVIGVSLAVLAVAVMNPR